MSSLAHTAVIDRSPLQVRARTAAEAWSRVAPLVAVTALVIIAPFEQRLFTIANFTVTTIEATMLAAVAVACSGLLAAGRPLIWRTPLTRAGVALLLAMLAAALAAPIEQGNAMRFVARMLAAAAIFVVTLNAITTVRRVRLLVGCYVALAAVIAVIAVLESAQVPVVMSALTTFRPGFHVVAGQLRATSTLFYPTIASMYLEIAFALGLWLLLEPTTRFARAERVLRFVMLSIIGAGIIATFTRAGLLAMAAAIALFASLRIVRHSWRDPGVAALAGLSLVLAVLVFVSHSPGMLMTRMSTEGSQDWYGARYQTPAALAFETGRTYQVPITLTNTGRLTWDSTREPAFAMSYHWLRAESEAVVQFDGQRTPFDQPVPPGGVVTMPVYVHAPGRPGTYTLVWDVVHETRAWLSTEGVSPSRTVVTVEGAPVSEVKTTMDRLPRAMTRPARPALWGAVMRIAADRPLLGVGPDNFRHIYGRYTGIDRWDRRVHANNMYLEVLAGAGVLGLAALLWLVATAGTTLWRRWRHADRAHATAFAAMLAAWLVIAGHGLVDSFLSFTTTYVTFALVAGLAFSPGLMPAHHTNADRV